MGSSFHVSDAQKWQFPIIVSAVLCDQQQDIGLEDRMLYGCLGMLKITCCQLCIEQLWYVLFETFELCHFLHCHDTLVWVPMQIVAVAIPIFLVRKHREIYPNP